MKSIWFLLYFPEGKIGLQYVPDFAIIKLLYSGIVLALKWYGLHFRRYTGIYFILHNHIPNSRQKAFQMTSQHTNTWILVQYKGWKI